MLNKLKGLGGGSLRGAVLLLLVLAAPRSATASPLLYAITHFSNELITIDAATGAGTLVGVVDPANDVRSLGLATVGNDLYTYAILRDALLQLDPATGAIVDTIDPGIPAEGEGGLTFGTDGTGYLNARAVGQPVGAHTLWSFDIASASSTLITGTLPPMDGLDFGPDGVLYGLSLAGFGGVEYQLYTIDPATGATALIGPTGIVDVLPGVGALAFGSDQLLYSIMNDNLYTLNVLSGAATLIGPTGFTDVAGLTEVAAVPEPSTVMLVGMGLAGFLRRRRGARVNAGKGCL